MKLRTDKYSYAPSGIFVAILFFCLSMLPSLLPRPWLFQGLIAGITASIGYGIGISLSSMYCWVGLKLPSKKLQSDLTRALSVGGPAMVVLFIFLGNIWQREVSELVGRTPNTSFYMIPITLLSVLAFIGCVGLARSLRKLFRFTTKRVSKFLPKRASMALSFFLVGIFIFWIISGVLFGLFESQSKSIYSSVNDTTPENVYQPEQPTRSGSSESFIAWDTLGAAGQRFVSRGPSQSQLQEFTGTTPTEPIRIYSGFKSATTAQNRAELAVAEMKRTGAFDRSVIVLATTTGTGWLEPQSIDTIEYMYGGDTAIVTQQYSFLPSWISFLVDTDNARETGRVLYEAAYDEWAKLPEDTRPKLLAYGLSLGSFGGQSAFSGINDIKNSIDGALFLGTPYETELWSEVTANRDQGSPQWKPVYKNGETVRFASKNEDILADQSSWQGSRVLYIQHASDPVVWFSFDLMLNKPDWLKEPRGDDVSDKTRWYPFVTFFQVAIDQFFGTSVPNGHGHNYPNTIVNAWSAVAQPTDWTPAQASKLQTIIDGYTNE